MRTYAFEYDIQNFNYYWEEVVSNWFLMFLVSLNGFKTIFTV